MFQRILALAVLLCAAASAQMTTITSTIRTSIGASLFNGRVVIEAPAMRYSGTDYARQTKTVTVSSGSFSTQLLANSTADPVGTTYRVTYYPNGEPGWSETWEVPYSASPLTIADVRIARVNPPNVASLPLSQIAPSGATNGQGLIFNGTRWAPGDHVPPAWSSITGKPPTFTPSAHASTHAASGSDPLSVPYLDSSQYAFTRANGTNASGDLSASGAKTVTLTTCPLGVAGSDTDHRLYISGGSGTAETVLITGGTCTSGAASGTVTFTTVNTHSGAWAITSASAGIDEAIRVATVVGRGLVTVPPGVHTVSPDAITVTANIALRGAGIDKTAIIPRSTGTNLVKLTGNSAAIAGMTLDATAFQAISNIIYTESLTGGFIEDVKTYYGANGLTYGADTKYTHASRVIVDSATSRGFSSATDSSAENYFEDINIGGGSMVTGFYVSRTNSTDIGGYYVRRMSISGASTMTNALRFTSTAADTPFLLFCSQCVFDLVAGDAVSLNNAQHVSILSSWIVSVGAGANAISASGNSSIITVADAVTIHADSGAALALSGSPEVIRLYGNLISASTDRVFDIANGTALTDVGFYGNSSYGIPLVNSGQETALASSFDGFPHQSGPMTIYHNGGGNFNSTLGLYDLATDTAKWIRVNSGSFQVVKQDFTSHLLSLDDSGNLSVSGQFATGVTTFSGLGSPSNGKMIYCSDCQQGAVCAGGGTGAIANRLNGAWICGGGGTLTEINPGTGIVVTSSGTERTVAIDTTTTPQYVTSISAASGSCATGAMWLRTTNGVVYYCTAANTWTAQVPSTRTISTSSPLSGGGDLSADRTLSCPTCEVTTAKGAASGYAGLDSSGQVPEAQMPALSGDVTSQAGSTTVTVTKLQGRTVATTAPTIGQALTYDGSQWAPGSPVQAVDLTVMRRDEAFCTGDTATARIGALGWFLTNTTGTGTVSGPTTVTPVSGYPCAVRLNTAAQASASSGINASAPAQVGGAVYGGTGITWEWGAIIVPGTNSTTLTGARIRVGYLTAIPADLPATGGMFWRYDTDAAIGDTAWKFQICKSTTGCNAASTGTDTTVLTFTGAPVAGTRYHLRARRTGTQVCASINGQAEQCTATTDMPTANNLMWALNAARTSGESTALSIDIQRWSEIISGLTTY